jgi:hypothetical protein
MDEKGREDGSGSVMLWKRDWDYLREILLGELGQIAAERERCAKIAAELDFEEAPDTYRVTAPGLEGLCGDWQRQQGYHADRIAALIREGHEA